jgi:hypothetical protein
MNTISTDQPTSFTALLNKLTEMKITLSKKAFEVSTNKDEHMYESTFLNDYLTFSYDTYDYFYLDAISNNKSWEYYYTETFDCHGIMEQKITSSFEEAYLNVSCEFDDIEEVRKEGNLTLLFSGETQVATISKLSKSDYSFIDNKLTKRFEKAFKGITYASSNKDIASKLKQFSGISASKINLSTNNFPDINHETTNTLFQPLVSNYVLQMKNTINRFSEQPITLSQAQELFLSYFCIDNWHALIKNEKSNQYSPYTIIIRDENCAKIETFFAKNYAESLVLVDMLMRKYPDNYSTNKTLYSGIYASGKKHAISTKSYLVGDNISFDNEEYFNQRNELLSTLKTISSSYKSINYINDLKTKKKLFDGMPIIFEKTIEGITFYLSICHHRGISILRKGSYGGYETIELGNIYLYDSEKSGICLARYRNQERMKLNDLSEKGLVEFVSAFGITYDGRKRSSISEHFLTSPAGHGFGKWGNIHLDSLKSTYDTRDFGVNPFSLLEQYNIQ